MPLHQIQKYYPSVWLTIMVVSALFYCQPVKAQQHSGGTLTPQAYSKWGTLGLLDLTEDGMWVSYTMRHTDGRDTLFLQNTATRKFHHFTGFGQSAFAGNNNFLWLGSGKKLNIINLRTMSTHVIDSVEDFKVATKGHHLILSHKGIGATASLSIINTADNKTYTIGNVCEYKLTGEKDLIAFATTENKEYTVALIDLNNYHGKPKIIHRGSASCHHLTWQQYGHSLAFFTQADSLGGTSAACCYNVKKEKSFTIDPSQFPNLKGKAQIALERGLTVADDGSTVFFEMQDLGSGNITKGDADVELWKGSDPFVHPMQELIDALIAGPKLYMWQLASGALSQVSNDILPEYELTGKHHFALLSNPTTYAPHYRQTGDKDFYLYNTGSKHAELLIKQLSGDANFLSISPYSDDIAYFKNGRWYFYDTRKDKLITLQGTGGKWDTSGCNSMPPITPYGVAGWSDDQKHILLYDAWDIWSASTDGKYCTRLTHGREQNTVFRISSITSADAVATRNGAVPVKGYNLSHGLLLEAHGKNNGARGLYRWDIGRGAVTIAYNDSYISEGAATANGKYVYIEERFNQSPQLVFKDDKVQNPVTLYRSNPQQSNYAWGRSEMISYTGTNDYPLQGALFYPAGYDPAQKYPMVVYIYQSLSYKLHQYVNPTRYNDGGFNLTDYTLNGYFVLLPDIYYEIGNPGSSLTKSVVDAVSKVISLGRVDPGKVGLIGHSFGGYETNFIITRTGLFAAAVSGSGISDPQAFYFSVGKDVFAPDAWRFEDQIFRFGKSFYQDKLAYQVNSPIYNAERITTPLLLWSGKEDPIVPCEQSMALYIALRRLGKPVNLLLFPEESHTLQKKANQYDLTLRIRQWFDYYLKSENPPLWMDSKGK